MDGNFYPVDVQRPQNLPEPKKTKKLTRFQIRLIAILCIVLIAGSSVSVYLIQKFDVFGVKIEALVEPTLDYGKIYLCGEGILFASDRNGKWGIIDKYGNPVSPFFCDGFSGGFFEGLTAVTANGKWGHIDAAGKEIIAFEYDLANNFTGGFASVKINDKWGIIDKTGKITVPLIYDWVGILESGVAAANKNGACGIIDASTGGIIAPFEYDEIPFYLLYAGNLLSYDELICVQKNGKYGLLDRAGNIVTPLIYDWIDQFKEGLAIVQKDGRYGYIDKTGELVIPAIYAGAANFSEGLAAVEIVYDEAERKTLTAWDHDKIKYGYIDKTGGLVIPPDYNQAGCFTDGLAIVTKYDLDRDFMNPWLCGIIDKKGNMIVPYSYSSIRPFVGGLAVVDIYEGASHVPKSGAIDKRGEVVVPLIYGGLYCPEEYNGKIILAAEYGSVKMGLLNKDGEIIIPLVYDEIYPGSDGLILVKKDGLWGIFEIK